MFGNVIASFVALPKLNDNFVLTEKPINSINNRQAYQKCLVCEHAFFGSTVARKAHVIGKGINGVRTKACIRPNKALVKEIIESLAADEKLRILEKQKSALSQYGGMSVLTKLRDSSKISDVADQAVLEFIATNDLAPHILDSPAFKKMKSAFILAGETYKLPDRHELSMAARGTGELGKVLA